MTTVYADMRWPLKTGIGIVMNSVIERKPPEFELVDLHVPGRIGSPFSPLAITKALRQAHREGVFWSAGFIPPLVVNLPSIVTVHDLTHLHFYSRFHAAYYNLFMKFLYRQCKAIVCVSDYTRNEFIEWSGIPRARQDNLPNTGVEALACGRPVIAFDTCGLPDIVTHQKTGWLAKAFDTEDLAFGIRWVLTDTVRHAELCKRARADAVSRFSYRVVADQYRTLYENVVAASKTVV